MSQDAAKTRLSPFTFVTDLWRHRDLLWQFTLRNVELRHKGSHLGLIWALLNPVLMLNGRPVRAGIWLHLRRQIRRPAQ